MKFIITGSGGCVCTPKPCCQCSVCVEARKKGYPYARTGCSLYLEDIALLVDTPEDIAISLNNADIQSVNSILYSHWDPDHTLGMRIMEQLRLEWLDHYQGIKPENPIAVYAQPGVMDDINAIRSPYGPFLDYYEKMGLIKRHEVEQPFTIDAVKISLVSVPARKAVSVLVFEAGNKKVLYAPCDCIPFPEDDLLYGADVLIMGNTFIGDRLKNGVLIGPIHPLRKELHSMKDALRIQERISAQKLVITHIEEDWGKSLDDYQRLEREYNHVYFAFDGMAINV